MKKSFIAALALATAAAPGFAAERPLWELGVGVGGLRLPHYRGSDQSHNLVVPVPFLVYRGEIFKSDKNGTRAVLLNTDSLDVDLSVAISAPTQSRSNNARRGMANLAPTFELGPNMNWTVAHEGNWKLDLRWPVRAVATLQANPQMVGWTSTPNANLDVANLGGWNLGVLVGPVINSRHMNGHFYDVGAADATTTRPSYSAAGGYAGSQFVTALSRRDQNSFAGFFVKFDTLRGAQFADSPLVRRRDNLSFGFAMSWVLKTSESMVSISD
jgi:outer membrane scaffolding protein for murein synthesis (MipA/OmpV family)